MQIYWPHSRPIESEYPEYLGSDSCPGPHCSMYNNRWFWLTDIKQWLEPFCPLGSICLWCRSLPVPCFQLSPTWTSIRRLSWWGQSATSHHLVYFPPSHQQCNVSPIVLLFLSKGEKNPWLFLEAESKISLKKICLFFFFFHFSTANTMYLVLAVGTWYFFSLILFLVTKFEQLTSPEVKVVTFSSFKSAWSFFS